MEIITYVMVGFAVLGGLDLLFGNRFGLGKEFERGFEMLGVLALSMLGLMTLAPAIARLLEPALEGMSEVLPFDPSLFTSFLFANDNGGAVLAEQVAKDPQLGLFNGNVVACMMGCTISFTVPFALSTVPKALHKKVLLGLLCGIVTVPAGCFAGGLILAVPFGTLLMDLLPILFVSLLIGVGLWFFPKICVKVFGAIGTVIKSLIVFGLILGVLDAFTGLRPISDISPLSDNAGVILSAAALMSGAFPLIFLLKKALTKPLRKLSAKTKLDEVSSVGFLTTLATSVGTFGEMEQMNSLGVVLNSAFAVSAAFLLTDHLAFTVATNPSCLAGVMVGKAVAAIPALFLAYFVAKRSEKDNA